MLNRLYFWGGIAVLIYIPVMFVWIVCHAAGHWQWGPHGIPIPLQGEIPGQYPDGTRMNIVDILLLQSGHPELIYAFMIGMVVFAVTQFLVAVRQANKLRRTAELMMESYEKLLRARCPEKADEVKARMQSTIRRLTWFPRRQNEND